MPIDVRPSLTAAHPFRTTIEAAATIGAAQILEEAIASLANFKRGLFELRVTTGETGQAQAAVFETAVPVAGADGATLALTLTQAFGEQHTLGRFRLLATTAVRPVRVGPPDASWANGCEGETGAWCGVAATGWFETN